MQLNSAGQVEQYWRSDPFGNYLTTTGAGSALGATEHMFTGKERDTESGNDYFGARYYASSMGRFMSPDWSEVAEPVPYASKGNPQSLNLYAYTLNNPMAFIDPTGHFTGGESGGCMDEMMDAMYSGADPFGGANCQSLNNSQYTPGAVPGGSAGEEAEAQYASGVSATLSGGLGYADGSGVETIYLRCTGANLFNFSCIPDQSSLVILPSTKQQTSSPLPQITARLGTRTPALQALLNHTQ